MKGGSQAKEVDIPITSFQVKWVVLIEKSELL